VSFDAGDRAISVVRVDLYRARLELVHEFETSSHRKGHIEHILVRVADADGGTGWGEVACPSDPYYCEENVDTCWLMLKRYLVPALLDAAWTHPQQVGEHMSRVRGNRFAKAGLEMACWDLHARRAGISLAEALGGTASRVPAGVSLGIEPTVERLLETVERHARQGYRRVKLKIRPGWDVEPVRAVRSHFPQLALQVDANCAYRPGEESLSVLRRLDRLGLSMIEQPFAAGDLLAHRDLQRALDTPVCLDESIVDADSAALALALGACRVVNIKVSRLGGLGPARALHDLCRERGIPVWCGGMHEFGIGRAANVAIASLPGFTLPGDVSGSDKYYARDLVQPPVAAHGGEVPVPWDRPGLGHEIVSERLEEALMLTETMTARSAAPA